MKKLDLANNKFTGFISQNLTYLDSLSTLNLQYNQFRGQVPEFTGLIKLEYIYLDYYDFTGTLPNLGRDLVGQVEFTISHNCISGGFPGMESINASEFFEKNHKTQRVDFSFNQMTGTIPELIALIPTIRYVDISSNRITGFLPAQSETGAWKSLEYFGAAYNQLTGTVPVGFSDTLTFLDISNNFFTGGVPLALYSKFPFLEYLRLSNNNLGGHLSGLIGQMGALQELSMSNCSLSGFLPNSLRDISSLAYVTLNNNFIEGSIPSSIGLLTHLIELELENNKLTGTLPSELGSLSQLKVLNVANNSLMGTLPSILLSLGVLAEFNFSGNSFTGEFPMELCDSVNVKTSIAGCNKTKQIPSS